MPDKKVKNITNKRILDADIFKLQADFCRVLSEPKRLQIMWLIREKEMTVTEIAETLKVPIPNVSQHLRIMRDLKAVKTRRKGRKIYYRISNIQFAKGSKLICEGLLEILRIKGRPK